MLHSNITPEHECDGELIELADSSQGAFSMSWRS